MNDHQFIKEATDFFAERDIMLKMSDADLADLKAEIIDIIPEGHPSRAESIKVVGMATRDNMATLGALVACYGGKRKDLEEGWRRLTMRNPKETHHVKK